MKKLVLLLLFILASHANAQWNGCKDGWCSASDIDGTVTPVSQACSTTSGTTTTFTSQSIGNAAPNRITVLSINWSDSTLANTAQITSVTVGGVTMSRAITAVNGATNSNSEIWWAQNPSGTNANVVVTSTTAINGMTIGVYSLINYSSIVPVSTAIGTTSASSGYTNKQVAIAAGSRQLNTSTSLSNLTNDFSSACGSALWGVSASSKLNGNGTLTTTISPTTNTPEIAVAIWAVATPPVCSQATAFLARTSGLNALHTAAYQNLICGLVTDGVWAKLDVLHIYATQDSTTALLNLVSSSYTGVTHNSPVFTADRGFTGIDGSTSVYIDTTFNIVTAPSPQYTLNAAHVSAWSLTNALPGSGSAGCMIGEQDASSQTNIFPRYVGNISDYRVNGTAIAGVSNSDGTGHYIANRSSNTAIQGYRNGVSTLSTSDNSVTMPSNNMFVLALNNAGNPTTGFGGIVAQAGIGGDMSSLTTAYYNRIHTYMITVGASN